MAALTDNSNEDVGRGANLKWKLHVVLTIVQLSYAGSNIIIKIAFNGSINPIVFAVYRDALCLCFLIPTAYFSERYVHVTSLSVFEQIFVRLLVEKHLLLDSFHGSLQWGYIH
jgi:hypothetical protein